MRDRTVGGLVITAGIWAASGVAVCAMIGIGATVAPLPHASADPGEYGPCAPCTAEMTTQSNYDAPDGECQHGKQYDAIDCQTNPCCEKEFGGPGCKAKVPGTPNDGECSCATCYPSGVNGCKDIVQSWTLWCGRSGSGTCIGTGGKQAVPPNKGPQFIVQPRTPANPAKGCAMPGGQGAWLVEPCGFGAAGPKGAPAGVGMACKAGPGTCVNSGKPLQSPDVNRPICDT
jgi:hypothetical protein